MTEESKNLNLPPADFSTLIVSLSTSVQLHLGMLQESEDSDSDFPMDLNQAKYSIDLLAVLKEKTVGNLTKEEDQLLEQMLYELRIAYVQKTKEESS